MSRCWLTQARARACRVRILQVQCYVCSRTAKDGTQTKFPLELHPNDLGFCTTGYATRGKRAWSPTHSISSPRLYPQAPHPWQSRLVCLDQSDMYTRERIWDAYRRMICVLTALARTMMFYAIGAHRRRMALKSHGVSIHFEGMGTTKRKGPGRAR